MKQRIGYVLIAPSPYAIERFNELAKNQDIELYLFFEFPESSAKPDWLIKNLHPDIKKKVLKSFILNKESLRAFPLTLPFFVYKYKMSTIIVCNATQIIPLLPLKLFKQIKLGMVIEDTIHSMKTKSLFKKIMKEFIYRKADFYLAFSKDAIEFLKNININNSIFRTSWSLNLQHFQNFDKNRVEQIRNESNLCDKLTFITISRLDPAKGILKFLQALRELPIYISCKIAYLIVGSGPQENELREFIKLNDLKNVNLLGYIHYDELVNYYHAADIFVLPTLKDLFSLTVMEAMACGLPVLTTIYNGARELIIEGKNGYIFDSNNINDIKRIIIKIYQQREKLKEMGKFSLEIIKNYSHEKVIKNLKEILNRVLK